MKTSSILQGVTAALFIGGLLAIGGCKGDGGAAGNENNVAAECKKLSACVEALKADESLADSAPTLQAAVDQGNAEACTKAFEVNASVRRMDPTTGGKLTLPAACTP